MSPFRSHPVTRCPTPTVGLLALALAACGGGGAAAQPPSPADGELARVHFYEVSPEHAASLQAAQEVPFIEVSGSASVAVSPDRVRASFAVETRAATAEEAAAGNAELMDRVVQALRASGVQGVEVETFGYDLRPEYRIPGDRAERVRVIDGYTAVNNIRVTAADVSAAGALVDTAIRAGANRVAALVFEASDTEAAREEALRRAVTSARAQALAMAGALGRVLGAPLEVRGGAQLPYPRVGGDVMFRAAEMAADTPIEAGDLTVSASVTIRFALGGALEGR